MGFEVGLCPPVAGQSAAGRESAGRAAGSAGAPDAVPQTAPQLTDRSHQTVWPRALMTRALRRFGECAGAEEDDVRGESRADERRVFPWREGDDRGDARARSSARGGEAGAGPSHAPAENDAAAVGEAEAMYRPANDGCCRRSGGDAPPGATIASARLPAEAVAREEWGRPGAGAVGATGAASTWRAASRCAWVDACRRRGFAWGFVWGGHHFVLTR